MGKNMSLQTPEQRIAELRKKQSEIRTRNCAECDRDELQYMIDREIERLENYIAVRDEQKQ